MSTTKNDTYVELDVYNGGVSIDALQDYIDRARASGLKVVDCEVDRCPWYGDINGVRLQATR